jgi:hypothetical protein
MNNENQPRFGISARAHSRNLLRRSIGATIVAVVALAICSTARAQTIDTPSNRVLLPIGTVLAVVLNKELSSNVSIAGDTFSAAVSESNLDNIHSIQGATVIGVVNVSTPRSVNEPGLIELSFTALKLANGRTFPMTGLSSSLDPKLFRISSRGVLHAHSKTTLYRLTYAGIGDTRSALVRIMRGDRYKIVDVISGNAGGYAIGSTVRQPKDVHNVDLPAGTTIGVILSEPLDISAQKAKAISEKPVRTIVKSSAITSYRFDDQSYADNIAPSEPKQPY